MKIQDSVAFVTGAHRGLGRAFSKELLGRGVKKVYAGVRNPNGLDVPGVVPIKVDVTDPASLSAAAARCRDVTLLVNNVGIPWGYPQTRQGRTKVHPCRTEVR